jgi:hypothetical protein
MIGGLAPIRHFTPNNCDPDDDGIKTRQIKELVRGMRCSVKRRCPYNAPVTHYSITQTMSSVCGAPRAENYVGLGESQATRCPQKR